MQRLEANLRIEAYDSRMNRDKDEAESLARMTERFRPGVYEHYKGRSYLALGLAREDETDEIVVVYTRLYQRAGLPMSTRRLRIWNEEVPFEGHLVPRFDYRGHVAPAPPDDEDDPDAPTKRRGLVGWVKDNL
jgi:hypothetical protein